MTEVDTLRGAKPINNGGLFLTEFPVKVRILTLDPLVSMDKYGNTRYAFVVWSLTENKPKILNKGASFYNRFIEIHNDEDFGSDIRRIDVKISSTGAGKETRYTISPLNNPSDLPNEKILEAAEIKLESVIKNGIRFSKVKEGAKVPTVEIEPEQTQDETVDLGDDEIKLEDIPF